MISADGKETAFPVNQTRNRLNKDIKKQNFKKDLMNLTETNHQTNMTSEHSVSSNKWFKNHFNVKHFNIFVTLWQLSDVR